MLKTALFLSFTACAASTSSSEQALSDQACPDPTPSALAPAADQDLEFTLDAVGVQIYSCTPAGTWLFVAPDAQLYAGESQAESVGHHYAGPTWEFADGSTVVGRKVAAATVDRNSIPWLLLVATSHNDVVGRMTDVTAVQRLETSGGIAPAGSCTPGDTANVPYTATYFFYRTHDHAEQNNTRCGA